MSATDLTTTEITESLTGFDEIAIEKHMGIDIYVDAEQKPMVYMRSLVFVHKTREGLNAPDAREFAMGLRVKDVNDYFAADEDIDPDAPDSESGKESALPD